jgi:hypothetical protein
MGDRTVRCSVLVGKSERNKLLGRHGLGWEDNIRMNLQEIISVMCTGLM